MKTLVILLLAISCSLYAQKSDTMVLLSSFITEDVIIYTVGDVYKIATIEDNPFISTDYKYVKIIDIKDGWIKHTFCDTYERVNDPEADISVTKRREFYKMFLKRHEWDILKPKQ